jgi:hypothetical protein
LTSLVTTQVSRIRQSGYRIKDASEAKQATFLPKKASKFINILLEIFGSSPILLQ